MKVAGVHDSAWIPVDLGQLARAIAALPTAAAPVPRDDPPPAAPRR